MIVRRRIKALAAVASLATAAAGFAVVAAPAGAIPGGTSQSWTTPGTYLWVVPTGVTSVQVVAEGGEGADGGTPYGGAEAEGGLGGRQTATISVTPGSTVQVTVGGAAVGETGGFNGGGSTPVGDEAGGGGGASDVRLGGPGLADRVVVAGGGGGGARLAPGGYAGSGGAGGGAAGTDAEDDMMMFDTGGRGGGAGTASAGGAGGAAHLNGSAGIDGSFGVGGDVAIACEAAGAGGGGWYGGGGGSSSCWMSGGGGGGGSNYAIPAATGVLSENGVNSGDGSVTLSWTVTPTTTTTTTTTAAPPASTPTAAAPKAAPTYTCPTHAIRVTKHTFWAVNLLRWICGYQISKIRNGKKVVTYVVPFGWKWKWTVNPRHGR